MRQGSIGIAPEGYPFIILCAFTSLIFAALGCWVMALAFTGATWFSGHFFRDPERVVPTAAGFAVSPADGKVVKAEKMPDPFSGEMKFCVCIFMNVLNVHVNRSPIEGKIKAIAYHPGKYFNAAQDKASTDNERCAYAIESKEGSFSVVQVAGLIARRIVCRVREGEKLERGERFGLIRFGSRVDVYLPEEYEAEVRVGEIVMAGQSVIAKRRECNGA